VRWNLRVVLISFPLCPRMLGISSHNYLPSVHLLRIVCSVNLPFIYWVGDSLWGCFLSSLHILVINPLSHVWLVKMFSHSISCLFHLISISIAVQKLFYLM
jgi:hypothetical protein